MDSIRNTLDFLSTRTPEQLDGIAARLIEELVEKNDRLQEEVEFLRNLMSEYVKRHGDPLAGGNAP